MIIGFACGSDDPPVKITVLAADISGILVEEDGCLRISGGSTGGWAIVGQKTIYDRIERRGDEVLFGRVNPSDGTTTIKAILRLGDEIDGGGGGVRPEIADLHEGAGFSERCPGPYWLLGNIKPRSPDR